MEVLSHRGYWLKEQEKNKRIAFVRSFRMGFGVETDIRDLNGELVISHDLPDDTCMKFDEFADLYNQNGKNLPLALNIKSDGLQVLLREKLEFHGIRNYFVFDMSVPDAIQYIKNDLNLFTRQSEYENNPSFYERADGVWMDQFEGHWIKEEHIKAHFESKKKICIVSPELHKRDYMIEWHAYKKFDRLTDGKNLMICTDHPELAKEFFNGAN